MRRTNWRALAFCGGLAIGVALAGLAGDWPWGPEADAVSAAPESHRVLLDNDRVRVLKVVGLESARIRYYGPEGQLWFETPADRPPETEPSRATG